jgi:hypothetical protein
MPEEPPKKKRKQMKDGKADGEGGRTSQRAAKRNARAEDPTLFPQVHCHCGVNFRKSIIDNELMLMSFRIMLLYSKLRFATLI